MGISAKPMGKLGKMLAKEKHNREVGHKEANKVKSKTKEKEN